MQPQNDLLSLEQLERDVWPEPEFNSHLVRTCHRLRKVRLSDLEVEDLRILLSQGIGLHYILPKAIHLLQEEPLAEGDFYPGDLLRAVLSLPMEHLRQERHWMPLLTEICAAALTHADPSLSKAGRAHVEAFLARV